MVLRSTQNRFSAVAASLGYAYQFRYGLFVALSRLRTGLGWTVALETVDDLVMTGDDDAALLQLKHRAADTSITDASPDLWKTLRVWSEGLKSASLDVSHAQLLLVTTATASSDSACFQLTLDSDQRDNAAIASALRHVAKESRNLGLQKAHDAYLALSEPQAVNLVTAIRLVSESPNIQQLDEKILGLTRLMARPEHLEGFMERLEGWWLRSCLRQLVKGLPEAVRGEEFDAFISDLREQFHPDNLPIDDDVAEDRPEIDAFLDRVFCKQLSLIDLGASRVAIAVRDFHRAFVQRSRWSHDGLLLFGELENYERRLSEAWEILFARMSDDLGPSATEEAKVAAAKELYAWAEGADFPIRPACTEGFVTRGSLHMLSDEIRIGWHPDFELRLANLLEPENVR